MSASLVRKSLAIVDPDLNQTSGKNKNKRIKTATIDIPEQHKLIEKIERGQKIDTVNLLKTSKKISVNDLRAEQKAKQTTEKEKLKKLRLLREICKVELDQKTTQLLFKRAITGRPVVTKQKTNKKNKKTAFTEEDFKRFEEEYFDE